jgi:class 3 adenylate cyclase
MVQGLSSQLAIVMFTDIVGSVALKTRLGLNAYSRLLSRHDEILRGLILAEEGAEIRKDMGDGYFAFFRDASSAVRCALLIQQAIRAEDWGKGQVAIRIGIHMGEMTRILQEGTEEEKDLGLAIDFASRVMGLAEGGQILLSRFPFDEARKTVNEHPLPKGVFRPIPLRWMAHGPYLFKGTDEPMDIFEVGADGLAPLQAPGNAEKARRVATHDQEETLGWRPAAGQPVPSRPGWLLDSKLGEGGFGEVWLARQERLGESRAFKFCFDAARLRSLKRELALFRLMKDALGERRDIAKLYDVKLDEPPYFLESEYTSGGSLSEWSDKQGGVTSVSIEQRLEIVAIVAEAVAAAHSVGVLHKDIKPSNILIDTAGGRAQPKLADFGIGSLAEPSDWERRDFAVTGLTMISEVTDSAQTGTPLYRPPESLAGHAFTTKGDVYALGVILYQMAVGDLRKPLAPGWERDVADPVLRGDIQEAVEGDPGRRLSDAQTLATRIRHLAERRLRAEQERRHRELLHKRKRAVRIAVTFSVVVGLLSIVGGIAAAYYIRGIRAANAEAVAARKQAEASAEDARKQAITASRLAAHSGAQYFLSEGRLREAYMEAAKAMTLDPEWQDGYTLYKVVEASRRHWQPVRAFPFGGDKITGAFVGPDLLAANGRTLTLFPGDPTAQETSIAMPGSPLAILELQPNVALVAFEKELLTIEVPSLEVLARQPLDRRIIDVAARTGLGHFSMLTDGMAEIRSSESLAVLAETPFKPANSVAGLPVFMKTDLTPSGEQVLLLNAPWAEAPLSVWKWRTDKPAAVPDVMHKARFSGDDSLLGIVSPQGGDITTVRAFSFSNSAPRKRPEDYVTPFTTSKLDLIFHRTAQRAEFCLFGSDGLHIIDPDTGRELEKLRYDALLPAGHTTPTLAALSPKLDRMALHANGTITVFQHGSEETSRMATNCWSLAANAADFFTITDPESFGDNLEAPILLERRPSMPERPIKIYRLQWPRQEGTKRAAPWGLAITPDGRSLAVLWQESFGNEQAGSTYGRKRILVYDLPDEPGETALPVKASIALKGFDGDDGRNNRGISITPDARFVSFRGSGRTNVICEVKTGDEIKRWREGETAAFSDDGRYLATADYSKPSPVSVWDLSTGNVVFKTPEAAPSPRVCFSSDARRLLVGTSTGTLRIYDLPSQKLISTLNTSLIPVTAPSEGNVFLAQKLNAPTSGALLIARLSDAAPLEIIQGSAHVLAKASFGGQGKSVALVTSKREVKLIYSLTLEEAVKMLNAPEPR